MAGRSNSLTEFLYLFLRSKLLTVSLLLLLMSDVLLDKNPFLILSHILAILSASLLFALFHVKLLSPIHIMSTILILCLSYVSPVSNVWRWLIIALVSISIFYLRIGNVTRDSFLFSARIFLNILLFLSLMTNLVAKFPKHILQFLSFGYDNAIHFTAFRGYRSENWFPNLVQTSNWTDLSLLTNYPGGFSVISSFTSEILIGKSKTTPLELSAYIILLFVCLILIVLTSSNIVRQITPEMKSRNLFLIMLLLVLFTVSVTATLITNGFPPYLLAILITLLWANLILKNFVLIQGFFVTFVALLVLLLITPASAALLFLPLIQLFTRVSFNLHLGYYRRQTYLYCAILAILSTITAAIFLNTTASFGWRQLLIPGGVNVPDPFIASFICIATFFVLVINFPDIFKNYLSLAVISGGLSVLAIVLLGVLNGVGVSYYALKQYYIWAPVALIYTLGLVCRSKVNKFSKFLAYTYCSIFSLLCFISAFPNTDQSPWMGRLPVVIQNTLDSGKWQAQVVDSNKVMSGEVDKFDERFCILNRLNPYETDLNSRWSNALFASNFISEDCFSIYWNSTADTFTTILDRTLNSGIKTILLAPVGSEYENQEIPNEAELVIKVIKTNG